jgi:hypothetical protein
VSTVNILSLRRKETHCKYQLIIPKGPEEAGKGRYTVNLTANKARRHLTDVQYLIVVSRSSSGKTTGNSISVLQNIFSLCSSYITLLEIMFETKYY